MFWSTPLILIIFAASFAFREASHRRKDACVPPARALLRRRSRIQTALETPSGRKQRLQCRQASYLLQHHIYPRGLTQGSPPDHLSFFCRLRLHFIHFISFYLTRNNSRGQL